MALEEIISLVTLIWRVLHFFLPLLLTVTICAMNIRTYEGEVNSDIGSRRILDLVVRLHLKMTAKDRGTSEESCLFRILPNQVFYDMLSSLQFDATFTFSF